MHVGGRGHRGCERPHGIQGSPTTRNYWTRMSVSLRPQPTLLGAVRSLRTVASKRLSPSTRDMTHTVLEIQDTHRQEPTHKAGTSDSPQNRHDHVLPLVLWNFPCDAISFKHKTRQPNKPYEINSPQFMGPINHKDEKTAIQRTLSTHLLARRTWVAR